MKSLAAKLTAILALVGIVMLPIIKFSVNFGNTLHQPASVIRVGGPTIDASLLTPLLIMAAGFTLLFAAMHVKAMRNEIPAPAPQGVADGGSGARAVGPARGGRVGIRHLMDLGPHAAFIWTAYTITFVVVSGLIAWLVADGRAQQRGLDELAARGVTRRSAPRSKASR